MALTNGSRSQGHLLRKIITNHNFTGQEKEEVFLIVIRIVFISGEISGHVAVKATVAFGALADKLVAIWTHLAIARFTNKGLTFGPGVQVNLMLHTKDPGARAALFELVFKTLVASNNVTFLSCAKSERLPAFLTAVMLRTSSCRLQHLVGCGGFLLICQRGRLHCRL